MSNANTPFGLKPVGANSGAPLSGSIRQFSVAAGNGTAIYIGDPVKLVGTSQTINGVVYADVIVAATGDTFVGVCTGTLPVTRDSTKYREASTQRVITVECNPDALFEVQDLSTGTPLTIADIGLNCDLVAAAGSATTGFSGWTLNNATEATTNTLDVKIIGLVNRADNDAADASASKKYLVKLNRHAYALQIAGV